MSGGTGRRRKPPVGEEGQEGQEQYAPPQPSADSYPQYQTYQTYQQPAQESYDYDWRQPEQQQSEQSEAAPQQQQPTAAPAYETPAYDAAAYQPLVQEAPAQPTQPTSLAQPTYQSPQFPEQQRQFPEQPSPPAYEQYSQPSQQYAQQTQPYPQPSQYAQPAEPYQQPSQQYAQPTQPYPQAYAQPAEPRPEPSQQPSAPAPSSADYFGSGSYEIPQQTPAAPPRARPEPRPEPAPAPPPAAAAPAPQPTTAATPAPAPAFEFEFDLDLDDDVETGGGGLDTSAAAHPVAAVTPEAPSAPVTGNRPADKDGYRPGDFSFVDEADDPSDVRGWLSFSESRADSRAERLRKLRGRVIAVVIVLALVAAGVGVYAWLGGSVPGLTSSGPTKAMILFRLDDTKGDAVGDALLVTDGSVGTDGKVSGSGSIVVIPAQMQINSAGFGSQTFGGNMADNQPPAGVDDVNSTFGVTPTGVRDMDETTFGILVDDLGGISLTTTTSVPASTADPKGVSQGQVTLTGPQAVAYATYSASGESASAQATRFSQVLNALVAKLPTESSAVGAYLKQLGLIPDATLPLTELSQILATLSAQQNAGKVTVATLPLTSSGALDAKSASATVSKLLGGTVQAGATAS